MSTLGPTNGFVFPDSTSTPASDLEAYYGDALKQSGSTVIASGKLSISGDTENALVITKGNKRFTTAPKVTGGLLVQPSLKYYNACNTGEPPKTAWDTTYYDWTVPAGVNSISAVAVGAGASGEGDNRSSSGAGGGGGALAYVNNLSVTPGETLRIYVGRSPWCTSDSSAGQGAHPSGIVRLSNSAVLLKAEGGGAGNATSGGIGGRAANCVGDVAYSGGAGAPYSSSIGGGGGGAAGYSANGNTGQGGSGHGGTVANAHGGGGVGLYGEGASGTTLGQAGSGGQDGQSSSTTGGYGGDFGGGGGGAYDESSSGTDYEGKYGGKGAVRIVWGANRTFPTTNVDLASSYDFDGTETNVTV